MIYPEKLNKDKIIGITAPSDIANLNTIDYSKKNIENMGYTIIETNNVRKNEGLVSSSGKIRAEEFVSLLENDEIGHIISARGGEFLMEMLPYLDEYESVIRKATPKWIQGYSDTSLLLYYLTTKYNIATIHAENLGGYSVNKSNIDTNIKDVVSLLEKCDKGYEFVQNSFEKYQLERYENEEDEKIKGYNLTEEVEYKSLEKKENITFSGRMLGGCVDVITMLLGTKYDKTLEYINSCDEGIIWYIDNCELTPQELYRRFWKMKELGWFNNVNGFLIGRTAANDCEYFTFKEAIERALDKLNVPIIYDVDIGHVPPQFIIINGSYATFEYNNGKGKLIQKLI